HRQPQVLVGPGRDHAAARGALEQALLEQVGLEHVLDRVGLLADRDGQGREPDRAAAELGRDRVEQGAVAAIEAAGVDLEHLQGEGGDLGVDRAAIPDLGDVADPLQQPVGDPRRAARALCDRPRPLGVDLDPEDAGRTDDDLAQVLGAVVLEAVREAEAVAQRCGQQAGPRRGPDQRERGQRQGHGARPVTLPLPPFTLIGATTRAGLLTTPLRDRFGLSHRLEHYSPEHLAEIVVRSAGILGVEVDGEGARTIAERSRGTPRVANRLLKRVRDIAQVRDHGAIDAEVAASALEMLEVDAAGLDRSDRALLDTIVSKFAGGPVGLSTLAVAIGEEADTIEDVLEPYLLQQGLLKRTPRGRVITPRAYEHLGLEVPDAVRSLF